MTKYRSLRFCRDNAAKSIAWKCAAQLMFIYKLLAPKVGLQPGLVGWRSCKCDFNEETVTFDRLPFISGHATRSRLIPETRCVRIQPSSLPTLIEKVFGTGIEYSSCSRTKAVACASLCTRKSAPSFRIVQASSYMIRLIRQLVITGLTMMSIDRHLQIQWCPWTT